MQSILCEFLIGLSGDPRRDAVQAVENVSNWTQTVPQTESQARPLTALEPEVQREVVKPGDTGVGNGTTSATQSAPTPTKSTQGAGFKSNITLSKPEGSPTLRAVDVPASGCG